MANMVGRVCDLLDHSLERINANNLVLTHDWFYYVSLTIRFRYGTALFKVSHTTSNTTILSGGTRTR
jgi:hypothetical protein